MPTFDLPSGTMVMIRVPSKPSVFLDTEICILPRGCNAFGLCLLGKKDQNQKLKKSENSQWPGKRVPLDWKEFEILFSLLFCCWSLDNPIMTFCFLSLKNYFAILYV